MKILWISGSRIVGGAERVTFQVLGELRTRGHSIACLYRPTPQFENELRRAGIDAYPARLGGSLNVAATFSIVRAFSQLRPDIALVTTSDEWVWASLVPRRSEGPRIVLVRHMALALPANVRWLANRRADAVIAISEAARLNLMRKPGIEPSRLHVIPNPVRLAIRERPPTRQKRMDGRNRLGITAEGRWVGFFGGTEPLKGLRDVMVAMRQMKDLPGGCNLLVGGRPAKDARAPTVEQLATEYGLESAVQAGGLIEDMEAAITACDAVVLATHSSLGEGAPLSALEAMACGTPVVAYAVGGIPELFGNAGEGGVLAAPDDSADLTKHLRHVLSDCEFAERLALSALERVRHHYTIAIAADRYEALFERLIGQSSRHISS